MSVSCPSCGLPGVGCQALHTLGDCTASLLCLLVHDSDVASLVLQMAGKQAQCVHLLLEWLECATTEDIPSRDMALQLLASRQSGRHLPSQALLGQAIQSSSTVCIRSSQQLGNTKAQLINFVAFRFRRHVLLWYVVLNCTLQVHANASGVVHAYLQLLTLALHSKKQT